MILIHPLRSNRTFMELKYGLELVEIADGVAGSNRTFMELKYRQAWVDTFVYLCSNRTFMELKSQRCRF